MSARDQRPRGARRLAHVLAVAAPLLLAAGSPQAPRAAADALGKSARAL